MSKTINNIPTQKDFNEQHSYPREYSEDGDVVVAISYTQVEALEKFKEYFIDTGGIPDWLTIDSVEEADLGWEVNPDYRLEEDNMDFTLLRHDSKKQRLYKGWVVLALKRT